MGPDIKRTDKKSYWLEEGVDMRDGRAEGLSFVGDGGRATVSLTPDVDGIHAHIFESLQLEDLYVGDVLCLCLFSLLISYEDLPLVLDLILIQNNLILRSLI